MDEYLIFADLVARWVYSREGLRKLRLRDPDFPKPYVSRPRNRGNRWRPEDILSYEQKRPELLDNSAKRKKVALFAYRALWGRSQKG